MNPYFPEIHGKLGFGIMRLPVLPSGEVDTAQFSEMIRTYLAAGFNYFDTAHGYLGGKSELAIRVALPANTRGRTTSSPIN